MEKLIWRHPLALAFVAGLSVGCGVQGEDSADTFLPNRSADKLIKETGRMERVVEDPTPQTGTGGRIPGYKPVEDQSEP